MPSIIQPSALFSCTVMADGEPAGVREGEMNKAERSVNARDGWKRKAINLGDC